jgi:6-phosphogluconate dehydrogenase (decarboxylating)
MVHNGVEYGMMAAIAEVWRRGSVVSSWLIDLTAAAFAKSPDLDMFSGRVSDSGEGAASGQPPVVGSSDRAAGAGAWPTHAAMRTCAHFS